LPGEKLTVLYYTKFTQNPEEPYFMNRTTSGTMEGINNKIKLIKRQGYGFTNFKNFRLRLLASLSH